MTHLKQEDGGDLNVIGSSELVHTLTEHQLVDEYRLMIEPVVVGGGKRLFRDDGTLRALRLIDSQLTMTGAIIATYVAARRLRRTGSCRAELEVASPRPRRHHISVVVRPASRRSRRRHGSVHRLAPAMW